MERVRSLAVASACAHDGARQVLQCSVLSWWCGASVGHLGADPVGVGASAQIRWGVWLPIKLVVY